MAHDPTDERFAMLRRVGGDTLIRDLIALLFEDAPRKLAAARAALERGDRDQVGRAAHALASSTGNLGARDMQQAAYVLEQAAHAGGDLAEPLARLEACWPAARDRLTEKLEGLTQ
jgi:HPt (histidine-containing phosphotransfer) domain-containing protein